MTRAIAQARLRYPMSNDRLVPFAMAGVGAGFGEFSGREDFSFDGGGRDLDLIGMVGLGLDYFVVDNIALSLEGKYFMGFDPKINAGGGIERRLSADSVEVAAGLRIYADHLGRSQGRPIKTEAARDTDRTRAYLTFKGGRGILTDTSIAGDVGLERTTGLLGEGGLGINFNRHWGAELDVNYTRTQVTSGSLGDITGYPIFTYTLLGRYRYPVLADRLVPYFVAGGGVGFGENGDRDQPFSVTQFGGAQEISPVAAFGAGIEYFIEDNFSVGFEAKYTTLFNTNVSIAGVPETLSPDFVALMGGIRIYYP